jgi:broad specificity phosphatase PhoE
MVASRRRLFGLLLGSCLLAGGGSAADQATTVLVVRHAEKASPNATDPPLSAAGEARARDLAHVVGGAGISAIYVTQYQRTRATVAPLAAKLHLTPVEHPAADTPGLVSDIRNHRRGQTLLVSGHSNTIPEIVKGLTGVAMEDIPDGQYDNLYVMVLTPGGPAQLTRLKYGSPTP